MIEFELFKISTSEDDDEDRERPLTPEELEQFFTGEHDLTPEEMEEIRRQMDHLQYPSIPYEDIPEPNRPEIPDAFQDAFNDDDDPDVNKALNIFKTWLYNKGD